jgi:hypothetical protein
MPNGCSACQVFPRIYGTHGSWECYSMLSRGIWYISLTSISILSSHIWTDLLNGLSHYRFAIKNFLSFFLQMNFLSFSYHLSLLHSHCLVKTVKLWIMLFHPPFHYRISIKANILITLLFNALYLCSFPNTSKQVSDINMLNCILYSLIIMISYKKQKGKW